MHGKKVTAVVALLLMFGFLTACGVSKESTAADKAETQSEAEDAIKGTNSEDGQEPLIDNGLHGECSGSDPRLQSVKVNTNSYKIKLKLYMSFNYLFISSQMSAKPYFIGSTGILLLW